MALETLTLPATARRRMTLDTLHTLAQGDLAEKLRLEAAARILCATRRAAELDGARAAALPQGAAAWNPAVTTAREFAEAMTPAAIDALLADAPRWAAAVLDAAPEQRRAA